MATCVAGDPREDQIARAQRTRNALAGARLWPGVARHRLPERVEDVPHKARAVEAPGGGAAPEVAEADEALRLGDDARAGEARRRGELRPEDPARAVGSSHAPRTGRVCAGHREPRPVAEDELPRAEMKRRLAGDDRPRGSAPVEAGDELAQGQPAGIATPVERRRLVGHRDLRPAVLDREDDHLLAVERLRHDAATEPGACGSRGEVAVPRVEVDGVPKRGRVDRARRDRGACQSVATATSIVACWPGCGAVSARSVMNNAPIPGVCATHAGSASAVSR